MGENRRSPVGPYDGHYRFLHGDIPTRNNSNGNNHNDGKSNPCGPQGPFVGFFSLINLDRRSSSSSISSISSTTSTSSEESKKRKPIPRSRPLKVGNSDSSDSASRDITTVMGRKKITKKLFKSHKRSKSSSSLPESNGLKSPSSESPPVKIRKILSSTDSKQPRSTSSSFPTPTLQMKNLSIRK